MRSATQQKARYADAPRTSDAELVGLLADALTRLGVAVRIETMPEEARLVAGYCVLRGEPVLFVAPGAGVAEQRDAMLGALRSLATADVWLPPVLRDLVEGP